MGYTPGQEKCIRTLDRALVVSAGAGSGKTFTLTERIAHAFECGYVDDIQQVLAITFTKKAAGEIKSRLKAKLRFIGRIDQALKVDDAWVSTIHGMCSRMLKAHAIELGIDPAFKVVEGQVQETLIQKAINDVLEIARVDGFGHSLGDLFSEYNARSQYGGISVESMMRSIMSAVGSCPDGFDAIEFPSGLSDPLSVLMTARELVETLVQAAGAEKDSGKKDAFLLVATGVCEKIDKLVESYAEGREDAARSASQAALDALKVLSSMKMSRDFGTASYKSMVDEVEPRFGECVMALRLAASQENLATLLNLAVKAQQLYSEQKHALGVLDNDDLLIMASLMMEKRPEIAAQYADKFKIIMVDEFQDTDQMQVNMIRRLAGPGACRLCTVGDAQQSIYRFRGADVLVYEKHLESVKAADEDAVIELPDNFRSHGDILSLVDRVFEQPSMFGGQFMSLAPGRDENRVSQPFLGGGPRIEVLATTYKNRSGIASDEARSVEARSIAKRFRQLADKGNKPGGMAILLRSMNHSDVYAQALRDEGLACVISGGSVFSGTPEVGVIQNLLRFIANPKDTDALYEVLAGPLFNLTAGDLLRLATWDEPIADAAGNPRFKRRNLDDGLRAISEQVASDEGEFEGVSAQLACAARVLCAASNASRRRLVARTLQQVVLESGWVTRLQSQGAEGLAAAGNVYKAIRIVSELEAEYAYGPSQMMREFASVMETAKEAPGALSTVGGDFVRIMTVHASKGLEFPIVAVAGLGGRAHSENALLVRQIDGRVYVSLDLSKSLETIGGCVKLKKDKARDRKHDVYERALGGSFDEAELVSAVKTPAGAVHRRAALAESERIGDNEESKRLLYVALTRAKEALVVALLGTSSPDDGYQGEGALEGVVSGLDKSGEGFACGRTSYDFGGSAPAIVERLHVSAENLSELVAPSGAKSDGECEAPKYFIAAPRSSAAVFRVPYQPAHEGIFSYSSISDESHAGDLLERLAQVYFVAADEPYDSSAAYFDGESPARDVSVFWANRNAAVVDEDDGSWAYAGSQVADADKATDLGTAFHRLAQHAVKCRRQDTLEKPSQECVSNLSRTCKLGDSSKRRLQEALDRWFASDCAASMASFGKLAAEVPFFVRLENGCEAGVFLEGEIDLLASSEDGKHASIVDYKTGGSPAEGVEQLARKHVLQAACYAYSLIRQGFEEIDATFVRVEQAAASDGRQPQTVRYRFASADESALHDAILEAYRAARG